MADPAIRFRRMLNVLPRIYTADVRRSNIGMLLWNMAVALTDYDDVTMRVLHDRWINLASGYRDPATQRSALELLGQLVGVPRLTPADAAPEAVEGYRERIRITATALSRGLATPRAILSLAIADLGLEACPLMVEVASPSASAAEEKLWAAEATVAWGVTPGVRRRCRVCAGGTNEHCRKRDVPVVDAWRKALARRLEESGCPNRDARAVHAWRKALALQLEESGCPNRDAGAVDAWVSENPVQTMVHRENRETGLTLGSDFEVANSTLVADRPQIALLVKQGKLEFPALQNRATGEITLFADTLRTNEELRIAPELTWQEKLPFVNYDDTPVHPWLIASPHGCAQVISHDGHADGTQRDVSDKVFYIYGPRFIDAVFDATSFSDIAQSVRTPRIRNGRDSWRLMSMPSGEITDLGAAAQNPLLVRAPTEGVPVTAGVKADLKAEVDLELRWFSRPPYTVRLRVPRNVAVQNAETRGAVDLLLADMAQARAAGVRVLVDFPPWDTAVVEESQLHFAGVAKLSDTQSSGEGSLSFTAILDATRFDSSVLQ
jgi:hypothetical protein